MEQAQKKLPSLQRELEALTEERDRLKERADLADFKVLCHKTPCGPDYGDEKN